MSDRMLWRAALAFALAGIGVAGYLTWIHYSGTAPICSLSRGCETVQHSRYASIGAVPVAVLGLAGYLALLVTLIFDRELLRLAAAGIALVGAAFSAWLTYVEIARIHAICQWCIASAALMAGLAVVTVWRAARTGQRAEPRARPSRRRAASGARAAPPRPEPRPARRRAG